MPTILRTNGYRFFFYSKEGKEPAHVHVTKGDAESKYWLRPVLLAENDGFPPHEIHKITKLMKLNCKTLEMAYKRFHGI